MNPLKCPEGRLGSKFSFHSSVNNTEKLFQIFQSWEDENEKTALKPTLYLYGKWLVVVLITLKTKESLYAPGIS